MIEVRRGADRFHTVAPGVDSRHSFSYGPHYDPDNLGFGLLMAHNEDRLSPGGGFDRHAHRGLDIVTWVLSGTLQHEHWPDLDGTGHRERLTAGMAQVLRTGSGVHHAEHAAVGAAETGAHYVQMWLSSGAPAADPGYECHEFAGAFTYGGAAAPAGPAGLVTLASGRADPSGGLALTQPGAELSVARLPHGAEIELPAAEFVHAFLARGVMVLADGTQLAAGDALRLQAMAPPALIAIEETEILVWTCRR